MKVRITLLALVLLNTIVYAQKTKKVTDKNDYPSFKETYYVLKSDKQIKHGSYEKEIRGRTVKQGQFENGVKTGIWEYYDQNGNVAHKIDLESDSILYGNSAGENAEYDKGKYSRPLIVLGGMGSLYQQIGNALRYPSDARRKGTQGKVLIQMIVNDQGEAEDAKVIEGVGDGLDEEAVRVMKLIDIEFLPALDLNGNPVKSDLVLPITFKLG